MKLLRFIHKRFLSVLMAGGAVLSTMAQVPNLNSNYVDGRNQLIKAMTGIDPLTQPTISEAPYGAEGWMPIGADSLVRFAGLYYPNEFDNDGDKYIKSASPQYIQDTYIATDDGTHKHQPFAITVQQQRDSCRRTEPVVVYFVARSAEGADVRGDIYVQSMLKTPECNNVGHYADGLWSNIYYPKTLIHQTRSQDDMIHGDYSNNVKRNEAFDALTTASACDLDGDGYDEILVFFYNRMVVFDGKTFAYQRCVNLSDIASGFQGSYHNSEMSYGYKTTREGYVPNTWTSVVSDIDGDGISDVLAVCHSGFYWDHLTEKSPKEASHVNTETGKVRCIFVPGGKGVNATPVVNSMGNTPQLMWNAKDDDVYRYKRMPRWNDISYNNHDGVFNHDMFHYYHITLTADVVYPNGMYNSTQPVLTIAWKYLWSDSPTESGDIKYSDKEFREGLHEWYQLTTYNLTDNKTTICQPNTGTLYYNSKVDIFELLNKAGKWYEYVEIIGGVPYNHRSSKQYDNAVNARASLGRPALKTWYAGGRSMPPFLFFEGMNMNFNAGVSGDLDKYTIVNVNALGYESGWPDYWEYKPCGRICGPIYTYYDHFDEDGALDDRESILVPVATRKTTDSDSNRYQDNEYSIATGRFAGYDSSNPSVTKVTATAKTIGTGSAGQNSIFHYVPYTANTAKVQLQGSYYTASNPIVKAVLAIPPYNAENAVGDGKVAFSRSSGEGISEGHATSTTVGGGFSMDLSLFKALKFGYSQSYQKGWEKSWAKSYTMTSSTEYSGSKSDLVVFNYIPVDCFEYKVTESPGDPSLKGKSFTFRRALNMLNGEAHIPEVCWSVDDYNTWMAGAGLPRIDKSIFPHQIGKVDSYRRIPKFISKDNIISYFPHKENGFYAVHDGGTAGSSSITHTLSISNGQSMTEGESFSQTSQISFGFSIQGDPLAFGCGINGKYGSSESWKNTTTLSSAMSVKGTIPAVKDVVADAYDFYQVWYEYADTVTGQNFMVCDWAVGQNNAAPVYANLKLVQLFDLDVPAETETFYLPQLSWSVMSNNPVHHCVLEYKVDGMTPVRNNEDAHALVTLDKSLTDWATVEMRYDNEAGQWVANDFSNSAGTTFASWEHFDYFTLTSEQKNRIRDVVEEGQDVYVHYRVKVYQDEQTLAATSNEVSAKLFSGPTELAVSNTMTTDLFSLPYGRIGDDGWQKVDFNFDSDFDLTETLNYADITPYEQLYLHSSPAQKCNLYLNGSTATEVTLDDYGNATVNLADYRDETGRIYLHGIRAAEGGTMAADAFCRVSKQLGDIGVRLSGYGAFPEGYEDLSFYEATAVGNDAIEFPLTNPNAIVVGGSNIKGVNNLITPTPDVMQGYTAEQLTITDGYDFCYDFSVQCPNVTFTRNEIPEGLRYATFVLPFAVKYVKGLHEYIDCDGKNIYFNAPDDGVIDAYLPIVIDMQEYEGNTITITGENFVALSPHGTFNVAPAPLSQYNLKYGFVTKRQESTPLTHEELADYNVYCFSLKSYKFVRAVNTFSISPFRAFFMLPKAARTRGDADTEVEALNIVLDGENIATGIMNLNVEETGDDNTYNIIGMRVGPGYKGIVIRNGKKIIIK